MMKRIYNSQQSFIIPNLTIMHISTIFVLITLLLSSQYLAVSAQSTPDNTVNKSPSIENSPCENDWDCINNNNSKIEMKESWFNRTIKERPGDFMCIQKTCKFVVAAGQPCRDETDCIAYHYSILYNVNVKFDQKDFCSPKYCNPESSCDGAWDQKDLNLPHFEKPSNCCNGLPSESKCDIIANDVDPCDYSSSCIYDKTSGSAKCFSEDRKGGIWIGIVICLLGGVAANIGLNVQKYAFTKHQDELNKKSAVDDDVNSINNLERSSLYRKLERFMFWKQIIVSPLWVFGLGIYIFGSLLGFVALKFAPQSLVAPLGVVSLVVNLIIAPILHHQKLTIWDIVGVVIIICGSIVITVFSGIVIQDYKLCALIGLFHRVQTIVYLSTIAAFICALFTFIRVIERNAAREDEIALTQEAANIIAIGHENSSLESTNVNESSLIEEGNDSSTVVTEQDNDSMDKITHTVFNKKDITDKVVLDVNNAKHIPPTRNSISSMRTTGSAVRRRNLKEKVLLPLAYAILASSLATITTLFAKSLVNLLTISFVQKDNQFKDLLSWMILLITVSTAIGQVYWINMGLKKYDALLQVPIFYCNWSLFDIIGGGIYYDEFHHFTVDKYVGFIVGICLIFFGVSLLSKRLAMLTKEEEKLKEKQKIWEQEMKKKRKVKNGNNKKNLVYDEKKKVKS